MMISKLIIGCKYFPGRRMLTRSAAHQRAVPRINRRHIPVRLQHVAAKIPLKSNFCDLCGNVRNVNAA